MLNKISSLFFQIVDEIDDLCGEIIGLEDNSHFRILQRNLWRTHTEKLGRLTALLDRLQDETSDIRLEKKIKVTGEYNVTQNPSKFISSTLDDLFNRGRGKLHTEDISQIVDAAQRCRNYTHFLLCEYRAHDIL